MWIFKSFTRPDGTKLVAEWYSEQDGAVKAAFLTAMKLLRDMPPDGWDRPDVGQLRRECTGLFEIVLKVNSVQHRPIGYMSGHAEFTFLIFAIEKDRKLPLGTCETAKKRIEIIKADKERASEFRIPK
jgi:hypothetical protein